MKLKQLCDLLDHKERATLLRYITQTIPASDTLASLAEIYDRFEEEEIQDLSATLASLSKEMKGMGL